MLMSVYIYLLITALFTYAAWLNSTLPKLGLDGEEMTPDPFTKKELVMVALTWPFLILLAFFIKIFSLVIQE